MSPRLPSRIVFVFAALAAAIALQTLTPSISAAQRRGVDGGRSPSDADATRDGRSRDGRSRDGRRRDGRGHASRDEGGDARADAARDPFGEGALGIEVGGAAVGEFWNLNDGREWLADGSAAVWWAFTRRATLVVEFHATEIFQRSSRNAFVSGFLPVVRWRLIERGAGSVFVEAGAGISLSDTRVPPRGTQFNYLLTGGAGFAKRLGPHTQFITGARLLHLSNNGREGPAHNPDIEALGGFAGLSVAF